MISRTSVENTVVGSTVTCPSYNRGNSVPCNHQLVDYAVNHCDPCNCNHGHCDCATDTRHCDCAHCASCHHHATTMTGDDIVWTRSKTLPNVYIWRPLQATEPGTAVSSKCARRRVTTEPSLGRGGDDGVRTGTSAGHQHTSCDRASFTSTPGLCNIAHTTTARCDGRCNVSLLNCRPLGKSANDVTLARCRTILGMTTTTSTSVAVGRSNPLPVGRPLCDVTKYLRTTAQQQQQQRENGSSSINKESCNRVVDRRCAPVQTRALSGSCCVAEQQTHVHVSAPLHQQQQQQAGGKWSADGRDDRWCTDSHDRQYCTAAPRTPLHRHPNGLPHCSDKLPSKQQQQQQQSNKPSNSSAMLRHTRPKRCLDLLLCCFSGNQQTVSEGKS